MHIHTPAGTCIFYVSSGLLTSCQADHMPRAQTQPGPMATCVTRPVPSTQSLFSIDLPPGPTGTQPPENAPPSLSAAIRTSPAGKAACSPSSSSSRGGGGGPGWGGRLSGFLGPGLVPVSPSTPTSPAGTALAPRSPPQQLRLLLFLSLREPPGHRPCCFTW